MVSVCEKMSVHLLREAILYQLCYLIIKFRNLLSGFFLLDLVLVYVDLKKRNFANT